MRRRTNTGTQPFLEMPVFQNWNVVVKGWYFACPSRSLRRGEARSMNLCGQHVVLFRGEDGEVRALDGFCPPMGTDLGIGTVKGDRIVCRFHQWEFDGGGQCRRIPCGETVPSTARVQAYAVEEKYGSIWVFPDESADFPVPSFPDLDGDETVASHGSSYRRTCHHHVTMINGIDVQHLGSVHGFDLEMDLEVLERSRETIEFRLDGTLPEKTLLDRLMVRLFGNLYGYSMLYSAGTMGLLSMARGVRLFGRFPLPGLHMIFAYRPVRFGETVVQPIYVTRYRRGPDGKLIQWFLIFLTKCFFLRLRDEDGEIYDNMRFNPVSLLEIDQPVRLFIEKINQLSPSVWSRVGQKSR